jgi:hypothetical protein
MLNLRKSKAGCWHCSNTWNIPAIIIETVYWAKLLSVQIRDAALAAEASLEIIRFYRLYHNVAF